MHARTDKACSTSVHVMTTLHNLASLQDPLRYHGRLDQGFITPLIRMTMGPESAQVGGRILNNIHHSFSVIDIHHSIQK